MNARTLAVAACALTLCAVTVPTVAHAEPTDSRSAAATVIEEHGVLMPPAGAITPRYSTTPEGGGTWTYGTNGPNNTAFSNFHHATRKHGSSVENGAGNLSRSADKGAKETARASIRKTYAGNHAYYRFVK